MRRNAAQKFHLPSSLRRAGHRCQFRPKTPVNRGAQLSARSRAVPWGLHDRPLGRVLTELDVRDLND